MQFNKSHNYLEGLNIIINTPHRNFRLALLLLFQFLGLVDLLVVANVIVAHVGDVAHVAHVGDVAHVAHVTNDRVVFGLGALGPILTVTSQSLRLSPHFLPVPLTLRLFKLRNGLALALLVDLVRRPCVRHLDVASDISSMTLKGNLKIKNNN